MLTYSNIKAKTQNKQKPHFLAQVSITLFRLILIV